MATTQANQPKKTVDGIWGAFRIQIKEEPAMRHPTSRNLCLDNHIGARIYRKSSTFLKGHDVKERLKILNAKATFSPTAEQRSECK
eukprot:5332353-Ditylum_brightwellii.AAC.1